jgi:hypothetical protein
MNKIKLVRTTSGWEARHYGPIADRLTELFGTAIIPTAYTMWACEREVLESIRKLNPDCEVSLG